MALDKLRHELAPGKLFLWRIPGRLPESMTLPRRITIGLWIVLPVLVALGLMRLRFDVEVLDLLPSNNRAIEGLKLYQEKFSNARELIITVHDSEAEHAENAARAIAEHLRQRADLVNAVTWQPPWLEKPG